MSIADRLAAIRRDSTAIDMDRFRDDFKRVFQVWRARGGYADDEASQAYVEAAAAVREHQHDTEWMRCAAAHFRQIVERMDLEKARCEQIAAEVRAERPRRRKAA